MTGEPNNDDWLTNPAPPPRAIGAPAHQPPPKPAPKPGKPNVTPLRPIQALAAELDGAPVAAEPAAGAAPAPSGPPSGPPTGAALPPAEPGGRPSRERPKGDIWDGCPVKPLGVNGAIYWYLDVHGQLRGVGKHDAQAIMMLFGRMIPQLCYHFAQWARDPDSGEMRRKPHRFDQTTAAMEMMQACSERGLFDPEGAVRGVGAWTDDDGRLVYHAGDRLWIGTDQADPGTHDRRIYPAAPAVPHPALTVSDAADPVARLDEVLATWHWERPDLDPTICLALVGVQMMGGALPWRPAFWFSGGAGTGKSTLQKLILHLHGGEKGLIQSTDATARGIASLLGQSTLPVALDELEPGDAGSTKERGIVELARVAASGGRWARGSSDQKGSTGQLRSTFLFSSILVPGVLKSQDLQRIILLNLLPLAEGSSPPDLRADTWRKRGAAIKRLLIDRWPSWSRRLELWREACAAQGVTGRDADNWATVLAMAQIIRSAELPAGDEMDGWARKVARIVKSRDGEAHTDADEVLVHLMSQKLDVFRRDRTYSVAQWVMVAADLPGAPSDLLSDFGSDADGREKRARRANELLAPYAIRVIREQGQEPLIFIGNKKVQPLLDLFRDTQWAGGAWSQSLLRVAGAVPSPIPRRLSGAGIQCRGTDVPIRAIPGLMDFPADRVASGPAAVSPPAGIEGEDFA